MLNSVSVIGRLQGDPKEVEVGDKTKVVFYVVVDKDYDRTKYDAIRCGAWRQTGDFIKKYFRFNMGGATKLLRTAIRYEHFAAPLTVFDVLLPGLCSALLTLSFALF